jgi:predicted nucleic acid-binding protein
MEQRYLIDSNAVIDYMSGELPNDGMMFMNTVINSIPVISIISKIEVLGYNTSQEAYQLLLDFIEDSTVIKLSESIVNKTISLRREYKIKIPDAIIAATAIENKMLLITRNTKDFIKIQGLVIIDPHKLALA